jgi:hypothetical protein
MYWQSNIQRTNTVNIRKAYGRLIA